MNSFCKAIHIFFSKNISIYAIFNDQSFNDTITIDIVSFEQLGPEFMLQITLLLTVPRSFAFCGFYAGRKIILFLRTFEPRVKIW